MSDDDLDDDLIEATANKLYFGPPAIVDKRLNRA
jgi:hypothetical protein